MSYAVEQTQEFVEWRGKLRDIKARTAIRVRLERAQAGNLGDHKSVGDGVSEMRVDVGAGYRLYFVIRKQVLVVMLAGGDKKSQAADIKRAIKMAKEV